MMMLRGWHAVQYTALAGLPVRSMAVSDMGVCVGTWSGGDDSGDGGGGGWQAPHDFVMMCCSYFSLTIMLCFPQHLGCQVRWW